MVAQRKREAVRPPFSNIATRFVASRYSPLTGTALGQALARTCKDFSPCLMFNDPEVDTRSRIAPEARNR